MGACILQGVFFGITNSHTPALMYEAAGHARYPQAMSLVNLMYGFGNVFSNIIGGAAEADAGAPGSVMGPCIGEIDRIVIRDVQYQFEENRCRNEEVNVNFQGYMARTDGRTERRRR
ncbi:hypothetical protein DPMN_065115 [Dreissena polymorpha]|uniref:Uncharacterized protein n=1 Tax=Dreissena polymorpha TaxID=45954 RepID=A0A9D4HKS5_DREPO|nr:hypothetical protein DPMN_065115 [Dreissena polymorpha]